MFPRKPSFPRDSLQSKNGHEQSAPFACPFQDSGYCEAGIRVKSQPSWRQMGYPSCDVQRKSSCNAQLLIRTKVKISLNKYKERVYKGELPMGTWSRAWVNLCRPSPWRSPRIVLTAGPAAPCHGFIDAIWKGKELLCPCGGAPALPQGPAGTRGEQHSRDLGPPTTLKWQPAPRNLSA